MSNSRAACHLMDVLLRLQIVPFADVSDIVQSMLLSIELSGPASLTETSASLLTTIMKERVHENPTHFNATAERVLNWLLSKWTPSKRFHIPLTVIQLTSLGLWAERTYSSLSAHHCNARDVLRVLFACLDKPYHPASPATFFVLGPIAQARSRSSQYRCLGQYLLLLDEEANQPTTLKPVKKATNDTPTEHHSTPLESRILDFCLSEVERANQRWTEMTTASVASITSDMMRIITNLCIVAPAVAHLGDPEDRRTSTIELSAASLCKSLAEVLTKPQMEQFKVDAVLETCTKSLPDINSIQSLDLNAFKRAGIYVLAKHLPRALGHRKEVKQSFYAEDDDFMDVEDTVDSQNTAVLSSSDSDVPRHELQAASDPAALRASSSAYLHLISSLPDESDTEHAQIPSKFVDHLVSLQESELLRSRQMLRALWNSNFQMSKGDCFNLLERYSEALIDPRAREYNTSEVANGMLVEVLIGTVLVWGPDTTDRDAQDLYENVQALYDYYVKGMEKSGVRQSANLQKVLAIFLHNLLKHHPDLGQNRKVPSVRTSLFGLLAKGEMTVKHHIAERLPIMFEDFVLSEHDKILTDVDSSLPGDDEGIEGIAVRLLVLSKLASQWHTLLRQCIYLVFATAGSVRGAALHAKRCIANVAQARGLEDAQSLFRLFSSQVIFVWLDRGQVLADIPYITFGYATLAELLHDITAEAVGQAIMRGRDTELEYLAAELSIPKAELLLANMGKAAAYTIAWDTCRGFARNRAEPSNSDMLKKLVGSDPYYDSIQKHSPQVLGYIFQTIDHEERFPKALEKKPAFVAAAQVMAAILDISHSTQDLNIGIEPAFSAFYLPDQLERLCRRTGDDPATLWSPSTYTFVLRSLLDRINPALGSLYARSMIRKIRILVALAGPIAYEGYPLQMTLQSLRPFLIDVQCAEDTVGIMQHLFENGTHYLGEHLAFLTGIGLSILISVRVFLGSAQDSTTQQSQHLATMTAANRFHKWLSEYLKAHADAMGTNDRSSSVKAFRLITTAASQVTSEGNSMRGSEESKLLLEILNDVRSGRKLLNKTSREVALNLLCQNFQPASMARDDILGSDRDAAEYAPFVWESCQRISVGPGYLLWAAKVLGRAYSAHGEVKRNTSQSKPWSLTTHTSKDALGKSSREAIVREVIDLFYSDNRAEVSLAEDAVRRLIARIDKGDPGYVAEMSRVIPPAISKALGLAISGSSSGVPTTRLETLEQSVSNNTTKSVSAWIRGFAMALCRTANHDPILGALSDLLDGIDSMAERLLPYILHLVLLDEFDGERNVRDCVSAATMSWFKRSDSSTAPYVRILIGAILYLRSQPVPREVTRVDRDRWLEIDFLSASQAANTCGMYRSALLFAETSSGQPVVKSSSRRSSVLVQAPKLPLELQLSIYKNLDEPDSFYGVERGSNLLSVLDRFEYEGDGIKSLLFRGARLDSQMRRKDAFESSDSRGTVKSLIMLNMNSVTHSLLANDQFQDAGDDVVESTLHTARKLGQWDIKAPETNHTESGTLFKAFQGLHLAKSATDAKENFERQLLATMNFLQGQNDSSVPVKVRLRTLAALTEADEVVRAERSEHLLDTWDRMRAREKWMRAGE
jgi:ataxia telangiectasia mutated family protein